MPNIIDILKQKIGEGVMVSPADIAMRAVSYWDNSPLRAKALLRPTTVLQVSEILKLCHEHNQTVVVHGGNTTCVQGTHSSENDVVISLERMNAIPEIDPVAGTAMIESGAILETVQNAVKAKGLFLPLDLGARGSCTIGGNLATNAGGINVLRYGMARSMVLGLEAVLPDGTIISSLNKMLKNNAGYDLKQLFIGSEGTLGIITRAVVKLMPLPVTKNTALVALSDFQSVVQLLTHLKTNIGTNLSAYEVMWGDYVRAVTRPGAHRAPLDRAHPFYVLFECDGNDPMRDDERFMEVVETVFTEGLIVDAVLPKSENERQSLWAIREDFEPILNQKPAYLYDVSLPISAMEDYVKKVQNQLNQSLPQSKFYVLGHIGDGNLHFFIHPGSPVNNTRHLSDCAVYEPLKAYGGSVSAEHGIGHEKKKWLAQTRSAEEIALMKLLKKTLDPRKILNPGVVID
ncbi:MAG: FAD-binding oxidoreductase [Robiginitomaculum sp.]|nr:MAG: FAD-binding oxidoreductase [Robiginitomaculum sp.]